MKYRSVGKSGLKISEVALGSWVTDLKGTAAEDAAKETVKLAYDSGVNFFDCETTDLTETLRAMSDLVAQGKVLYYGVSEEWGSARLEEAQRIIDRYNLYPITVVQPQYNLNDRYIEHEIMGTCRKLGIGITTFSPLAQGLLTGKYRKGQPLPAGSRATWQSDHQINDLLTDENLDKVEQLRKVADELGTNLPVLSMAWILQHPEISCVIAGASKPSQLENNMKAAGFVIPADAMAEIDKITGFHRFERHVG